MPPHPAAPQPAAWTPLEAPAGLGDLGELDGYWAHAAHQAGVAVLAGYVGDAFTWTPWGYPPPAAYRGGVPPMGAGAPHWGYAAPVAVPAPRTPVPAPLTVPTTLPTPVPAPRTPLPTLPAARPAAFHHPEPPAPAATGRPTAALPIPALLPTGA